MQCVCEWKGTNFNQASQKCCRLQEFWCDPNFPSCSPQQAQSGSQWNQWGQRVSTGITESWIGTPVRFPSTEKWMCWHLVNLSPFSNQGFYPYCEQHLLAYAHTEGCWGCRESYQHCHFQSEELHFFWVHFSNWNENLNPLPLSLCFTLLITCCLWLLKVSLVSQFQQHPEHSFDHFYLFLPVFGIIFCVSLCSLYGWLTPGVPGACIKSSSVRRNSRN